MTGDRGYYLIEARWEHSHDTPSFFMIDEIGGSLDDAKRVAQAYLDAHVASNDNRLEWVDGVHRKARCYYAHSKHITFRVSR